MSMKLKFMFSLFILLVGLLTILPMQIRVEATPDGWVPLADRPLGLIYTCFEYYDGDGEPRIYAMGGRNDIGSGGDSGTGRYDDVYCYNISSNTWSQKANMPSWRDAGMSGVIGDCIYYIGGYPTSGLIWQYNITTNTWVQKYSGVGSLWDAGSLSYNNLIWVIGGSSDTNAKKSLKIYNPTDNSWTSKASMYYGHAKPAVSLYNGMIYCFTSNWAEINTHVEVYNVTSDTWSTLGDAPERMWQATKTGINGSIYLFQAFSETLWRYDITTDTYHEVSGSYLNAYNHNTLTMVNVTNYVNETSWQYDIYTFPTITGGKTAYDVPFYKWSIIQSPPPTEVTLTITDPKNTTYVTGTVPVNLTASGGTIDEIWYNCKNGTEWVYPENQTYSSPTNMTDFTNGTYTFYGWANNTEGQSAEKNVTFTVSIIPPSVTLTITKPQNTTYTTSTIPVQLSASGGTIDRIWYNCKNGTEWVYPENQTYTEPTSMTGFINGTYTFYAWANTTQGYQDGQTVMFTVATPPEEEAPPPPYKPRRHQPEVVKPSLLEELSQYLRERPLLLIAIVALATVVAYVIVIWNKR